MLTQVLAKVFGTQHQRDMKKIQPIVDAINAWEPKLSQLSDAELQAKTPELKKRLQAGETVNDILPEAFAVCREASKRVLGMRHYDVQLIGGIVLNKGSIAEMKTGEGKTLVATLAVYLNALEGKGVHVVTVNDYLATRDAEWMGRLYSWLGLTTGVIVHGQSDEEKKAAYNADISYATNNELGFDYLRDNMKFDLADYVQRPLHYAIVDECDSILIDEARTPLIISGSAEDAVDKYYQINSVIPHLRKEIDFTMEEKSKSVSLTEEGNTHCEKLLNIDNLYDPQHISLLHHIYQGLKAHHLYHRDVDYMVKDDEVIIVDEFTGRLMEGRRWSDGLHQAVEAKEGVKVKNENQTLATITFQNFFRMYKKLSGMTGTAETEAVEMKKIYNLDVSVIPTNRPVQRLDHQDVIYKNANGKFNAIVKDIKECRERGQPVLVGTVSIERSEAISNHLRKSGIPHNVLNAKAHEREAEIVAQAGRKGAVTIATNMAGRGTDIVLGGNAEGLAKHKVPDTTSEAFEVALKDFKSQCEAEKKEVIAAGGLMIIGTERHESRRIDNQLRGRSGRQGDPGASRFFLALDDDLMRKFNGERIQKLMDAMSMPEDEPITAKMVSSSIESAQRKVEGHNFDIRKHLLEYDDVMNKQRMVIYGLRRQVLQEGDGLNQIIVEMLADVTGSILDSYADERTKPENWNLAGLSTAMVQQFGIEMDLTQKNIHSSAELTQIVKEAVKTKFESQKQQLGSYLMQVQKMLLLQSIDQKWKDHLQSIDQLREWINLRAYAQRDPLVEYKQEAFHKFEELNFTIKSEVIEKLLKIQLVAQGSPEEFLNANSNYEENEDEISETLNEEIHTSEDQDPNQEALEAMMPKQRQRLIYSNSGDDGSGGSQMSRSDRRKMERNQKKKRF